MKPDLQQKRIGAAAARLRGLKHWETLGVEGKATCAEAALVAADEAVPVMAVADFEVERERWLPIELEEERELADQLAAVVQRCSSWDLRWGNDSGVREVLAAWRERRADGVE